MFNVGPLELLIILAIALIVVGPEKLPELARSIGRAIGQLRQVQEEVRDAVSLGLDDEVRQAASGFKKAAGDLRRATDVRGALNRVERDLQAEPPRATPKPEPMEADDPQAERASGNGATRPPSPGGTKGATDEEPGQP